MNQHDMKLENKTGLAHGAAFPEVPTTPKQRPDTESTRRSCPCPLSRGMAPDVAKAAVAINPPGAKLAKAAKGKTCGQVPQC